VKRFYAQHNKKIKYLLVGGWNTVFGYAIFIALYYLTTLLSLHYLIALTLSQIISITVAYIANKLFVFKTKGNIIREYLRFCTFYSLSFLVNIILLPLFVEIFQFNLIITQGAITVGIIVMSFFWHNNITFSIEKIASVNQVISKKDS